MKAIDIIGQLQRDLPSYTNLFSDELKVSLMSSSNSIATVITEDDHHFTDTQWVNVVGVFGKIPLTSISINERFVTVLTSEPTDLSLFKGSTVTINGAVESEANGTFKLIAVPSRKEFTYVIEGDMPSSITGDVYLKESYGSNIYYNGRHQISVTGPRSFTYEVSALAPTKTVGDIVVRYSHRISGCLSSQRALNAYTKQKTDKSWAFVVLGEASVSKDRSLLSDSTGTAHQGVMYLQRLISEFSIFVFNSTVKDLSGRVTRDLMVDIEVYLGQALLRYKPPKRFSSNMIDGVTALGNGLSLDENSYYVHHFDYQITEDIMRLDAIQPETVSFNVIDLHVLKNEPYDDTIVMSVDNILLDDPSD